MTIKVLQGMLVYVQVQSPVPNYDKDGTEYKCGIVVDEDTADAFDALYPKQAAKKVKRTDFKNVYKVDPPEGQEKNLYVITLKKPAEYVDKKTKEKTSIPEQYRPVVLCTDGMPRTDITAKILPANGSLGKVSIEHFENSYGSIARLGNVLVTSLIPYEKNVQERGAEFGEEESTSTTENSAKPKGKVVSDQDDDDIPF